MDKLTWLKKKLGFDVEAEKKKKKMKSAGTGPVITAPVIQAAVVMGAGAGVSGATTPGWQDAKKTPGTVSGSPRMGTNRQKRPPSALDSDEGGYADVEGLVSESEITLAPTGTTPTQTPEPPNGQTPYLTPNPYLVGESKESGTSYNPYVTSMDGLQGEDQEDDDEELSDDEDDAPAPSTKPNITMDGKPAKKWDTVDASNTDYATGVKGATGMKGKSAGSEYLGEHNEAGWREKPFGVNAGDTGLTTVLNTEQERKDSTLELQEDGTYKKGDGTTPSEYSELGYAMDPKTGEMATFSDRMNIVTPDGMGGQVKSPSMNVNDGVRAFKRGDGDLEITHHTTALGGDVMLDEKGEPILDSRGRPVMKSREAASAGFVKFNFLGQMVRISNASGHYKPSVTMLLQAVEHLTKQGAFFEDEITDANGREVDPGSKPGQLYATVQKKLKEKAPLLQLAQTKTAELENATDEKEQERLAGEITDIGNQLENLTKELEAPAKILAKLGIAPSQRMRKNAKVEITEVKAGMTGAQIRTMGTSTKTAEEFLAMGGNEVQHGLKQTMMDELEEKTAGKKATLDRMAETRGARVDRATGGNEPAPSKDDVKKALRELQSGGAPQQQGTAGRQDGSDNGEGENTGPEALNPYLQRNDGVYQPDYEETVDNK